MVRFLFGRRCASRRPVAAPGRLLLCCASGLLIVAGFLLHVFQNGSILEALAGGEHAGRPFPPGTVILYACAIVAGGWNIAPRAFFAARNLQPDMNLLMAFAVAGAIWIGQWTEAASVTFLFSLALLLESWSVGRARNAIRALTDISPRTARFICPTDGDIEEKPGRTSGGRHRFGAPAKRSWTHRHGGCLMGR